LSLIQVKVPDGGIGDKRNETDRLHMIRWVRLFLAVLALAGVLGARPGMAAPAKAMAHHHHCMGMADETNCPNDDHGSVPVCCVAAICAMVQPVLSGQNSVLKPMGFTEVALPLLDDNWRSGIRPPPDLRPPIA
jgi:hypothetical protein